MIKIKFVDMYSEFVLEDFWLYRIIKDHFDVEVSETPDFLFYGVYGHENLRYFDCVRINVQTECVDPNFQLADYIIGFNSDVVEKDRYMYFNKSMYIENPQVQRCLKRPLLSKEELSKKKFCNFVYSNNNADPYRNLFMKKLSEYKKVDCGGRVLNNIGYNVKDKNEFQKEYKFTIAFENESRTGYCSEKLLDAFANETIPIYWGDNQRGGPGGIYNLEAMIDCHEDQTEEKIIEKIIELDKDDDLYLRKYNQNIYICSLETVNERLISFLSFLNMNPEKAKRRPANPRARQNERYLYVSNKIYDYLSKIYSLWGGIKRIVKAWEKRIRNAVSD